MLLGALWAFAASVATGVGLVAVHRVAGQVGDQISSPLSDKGVQQALAAVTPAPTPTAGTPSPSPRAPSAAGTSGELRTVRTRGGVVGAHCEEGQPQLVYATPAQGWRTDRTHDTLVRFVSARQAVTVRLSCVGDQLRSSTRTDDLTTATPASPSPSPQPSPHESSDSPDPSPSEQSGDGGGGDS